MIQVVVKRAELNVAKVEAKRRKAREAAQAQLDQDVLKDSNYYIPARYWILRDSSIRSSKIGQGVLIWDTPYARKLYYNPQYNFSTDQNPHAQGLWFEAAKANKRDDWLDNAAANYARFFNGI